MAGAIDAARDPGGARDDQIADTWRHVKQVARDTSKDYDLLDLLRNTRQEDTYQLPVPGVRLFSLCWVCVATVRFDRLLVRLVLLRLATTG